MKIVIHKNHFSPPQFPKQFSFTPIKQKITTFKENHHTLLRKASIAAALTFTAYAAVRLVQGAFPLDLIVKRFSQVTMTADHLNQTASTYPPFACPSNESAFFVQSRINTPQLSIKHTRVLPAIQRPANASHKTQRTFNVLWLLPPLLLPPLCLFALRVASKIGRSRIQHGQRSELNLSVAPPSEKEPLKTESPKPESRPPTPQAVSLPDPPNSTAQPQEPPQPPKHAVDMVETKKEFSDEISDQEKIWVVIVPSNGETVIRRRNSTSTVATQYSEQPASKKDGEHQKGSSPLPPRRLFNTPAGATSETDSRQPNSTSLYVTPPHQRSRGDRDKLVGSDALRRGKGQLQNTQLRQMRPSGPPSVRSALKNSLKSLGDVRGDDNDDDVMLDEPPSPQLNFTCGRRVELHPKNHPPTDVPPITPAQSKPDLILPNIPWTQKPGIRQGKHVQTPSTGGFGDED